MKIVMAEHTHYESLYRVGCHHLADYFVRHGHDVLYLSGPMNPFNLRYFLTGNPSARELRYGLATWWRGGVRVRDRLCSYAPLTLLPIWRRGPFASEWVATHTLDCLVPSLEHTLRRTGFEQPDVLLVSQLFFAGLLSRVPARASVLRVTDDIEHFPTVPRSIRSLEERGVAAADAVVVTSSPLVEKMQRLGAARTVYVPNGVDFEYYQAPRPKPGELISITGPIVVYIGAIDTWFDDQMLRQAAIDIPTATFVLIGAPRRELGRLHGLPNVRVLGPRPYADLPGYLQHSTVGIIPFQVSALIQSVSPLKLYEYMAAGLPVVSTRWRELEQLSAPVHLANSAAAFVEAVRTAIAERGARREEYRAYAKQQSWESRGQTVETLFADLLRAS